MSRTRTRTSAMPKPSTIATRRRRRPTAAGDNTSKAPYSTKGKILLQIFCRCRNRNRAVQSVVDNSTSGAGIASGTAAIGQPAKSGYSRMAQPCEVMRGALTCGSASPSRSHGRRRRAARTAPGRPPCAPFHAGEFGDACEEREDAPMTAVPAGRGVSGPTSRIGRKVRPGVACMASPHPAQPPIERACTPYRAAV